jgi:hypothetical protein
MMKNTTVYLNDQIKLRQQMHIFAVSVDTNYLEDTIVTLMVFR